MGCNAILQYFVADRFTPLPQGTNSGAYQADFGGVLRKRQVALLLYHGAQER